MTSNVPKMKLDEICHQKPSFKLMTGGIFLVKKSCTDK